MILMYKKAPLRYIIELKLGSAELLIYLPLRSVPGTAGIGRSGC